MRPFVFMDLIYDLCGRDFSWESIMLHTVDYLPDLQCPPITSPVYFLNVLENMVAREIAGV